MDTLIDLSTPAKPQQQQQQQHTSSQDFTPNISKALSECFKRRKQSLLPALNENLNTPDKNRIKEVVQTPLLDKENDENVAHIKCLSTRKLALSSNNNNSNNDSPQIGSKRNAPSTPMTPSLLKQSIKRRALESKNNSHNKNGSSMFSPGMLETHQWSVDECPAYDFKQQQPVNKQETPPSVVQLRKMASKRYKTRNEIEKDVVEDEAHVPIVNSCDDLGEDIRLEAAYDKWLGEQQLKELQSAIEFMELERKFCA